MYLVSRWYFTTLSTQIATSSTCNDFTPLGKRCVNLGLYAYTVKSIIQPAGYKGFRGLWGRFIVKGVTVSRIKKKSKNGKCRSYSRAGRIIGVTVYAMYQAPQVKTLSSEENTNKV